MAGIRTGPLSIHAYTKWHSTRQEYGKGKEQAGSTATCNKVLMKGTRFRGPHAQALIKHLLVLSAFCPSPGLCLYATKFRRNGACFKGRAL